MILLYGNENKPKKIRHSHWIRRKRCLYCDNLTKHYPDKSWNLANSVENLWLILAKQCQISGIQVSRCFRIQSVHLTVLGVLPFSYPHETGMHCCSIISPTETLCRLHYFLKVKHKVTWIKIKCDILWLSIFPLKIHSYTKWTENFSATIYTECETTIRYSFLSYAFLSLF